MLRNLTKQLFSKMQIVFAIIIILVFSCTLPATFNNKSNEQGISNLYRAPISGINVDYIIGNDWGSGFTADVKITNNSSTPIDGWNLIWTYAGNQTITNMWNSSYSQSGNTVTVTDDGWNGYLAVGGTATFGFQATYSDTNINPTDFEVTSGSVTSSSSSSSSSSEISSSSSSIPASSSSNSVSSTSGVELILNGNFDNGTVNWSKGDYGASSTMTVSNGELLIDISNGGTEAWNVQITQVGLNIENGKTYYVSLDAKASSNRPADVNIGNASSPWTSYSGGETINLTTSWNTYIFSFTMANTTDSNARMEFNLGNNTANVYIDNVSVTSDQSSSNSSSTSSIQSSSSTASSSSIPSGSIVEQYGQLKVEDKQLCDKNGNPVQLKGMSAFWVNWTEGNKYANADVINYLVDNWGITLYRVAMGVEASNGYISNPGEMEAKVRETVEACIANGIYVIIDWHSHDSESYQSQEIAFFEEMARDYGNSPNVIYEIWNEPIYQDWDTVIKPYCQGIVDAIRVIDGDNIIITGSSTWSQDVDKCKANPLSGSNLMYTLHFYAGTHGQGLRDKADNAMSGNDGIAIFITEWGTSHADGGTQDRTFYESESNEWINWMNNTRDGYKISWANWSICDKDEVSAALMPGASTSGDWSDSELSTSGKYIKTKF